jgi:FkbM family methyltransferase
MSMISQLVKHVIKGSTGEATRPPEPTAGGANLISADYARLNAMLHSSNAAYGTSGKRWAGLVASMAAQSDADDVLDYGCGKQTLAAALPDLNVRGYDPAIEGLNAPPSPADVVVCTDVLEHVEPDCIDGVLNDLQHLALKAAFVTVATRPAVKTLADGRNAHLTVQPFDWWKARFAERFVIREVKEIEGHEFALVMTALDTDIALTPLLSVAEARPAPAKPTTDATSTQQVNYQGKKLSFHTPNDATRWRVQTLFKKEPDTISWLEQIEPGSVLIDIGANVGMYTVFAATMREARVYAFEPESQNYALLNANIVLNKLGDRVVAYPLALSDQSQANQLHLSKFSAGGSCHSFGEEVGFDLQPRATPYSQGSFSVPLDSLVEAKAIPQPDYIKIDVDGIEHKVIQGALKTIQHPQLKGLIIELNTNLAEHNAVIEVLQQAGFQYDPAQVSGALRKDGAFKGVGEFIFSRGGGHIQTDRGLFKRQSAVYMPRASEMRAVLRHVAHRVQATPTTDNPFPHLVVDNILPEAYFNQARQQFPAAHQMRPIVDAEGRVTAHDVYRQRHVALFNKDGFSQLSENQRAFWIDFADWLYSDTFVNLMIDKFADALEPRLAAVLGDEPNLKVKGDALLVNDCTDYAIGPHTDAPHRLISFLFYMPEDDSMRELGTSIYAPKDPNFTCWGGPHHPFEPFNLVKTIEFLPNRLVCFPKTEKSFHGVEPISRPEVNRQLLINNVRLLNKRTH